jgi:hypothetical protein
VLGGVNIEIRDGPDAKKTTQTGANGAYTLSGLQPGYVTVRAWKTGYRDIDQGITLVAGTTHPLNFDLAKDPTPTGTRIIQLSGSLAFGSVQVGTTSTATLTVGNSGTGTLTVSGITYPTGFSGNWASGTIAAGGSRPVTVTFAPTATSDYGGTVTVNADRTSGTNTISASGTGTASPAPSPAPSPSPSPAPTSPPVLSSVSPASVVGSTFTLTAAGTGFDASGAVVEVYSPSGVLLGTGVVTSRSATQLVTSQAMAGAAPGTYAVKVRNPDGGISQGVVLTLKDEVSVSPGSGSIGTVFSCTGGGFTGNSGVTIHIRQPVVSSGQGRRLPRLPTAASVRRSTPHI